MDIDQILKTHFVATLAQKICGDEQVIIERPAAFMIRPPTALEDERNLKRLIIMPPKGYMSNEPNQTNCFQGVEKATITVKGGVRDGKKSFSKLQNCLLVPSFNEASLVSHLDRPYIEFDLDNPDPKLLTTTYSSHTSPFHIVKADGTGFYHTCLLYTSPSPRDQRGSRMPSSA